MRGRVRDIQQEEDMDDGLTIPANHQEFCKAVARLCREHGLTQFNGSFRPGFKDPWRGEVSLACEHSRCGERVAASFGSGAE